MAEATGGIRLAKEKGDLWVLSAMSAPCIRWEYSPNSQAAFQVDTQGGPIDAVDPRDAATRAHAVAVQRGKRLIAVEKRYSAPPDEDAIQVTNNLHRELETWRQGQAQRPSFLYRSVLTNGVQIAPEPLGANFPEIDLFSAMQSDQSDRIYRKLISHSSLSRLRFSTEDRTLPLASTGDLMVSDRQCAIIIAHGDASRLYGANGAPMSARDFATSLSHNNNLRLVILCACGDDNGTDVASTLAWEVLRECNQVATVASWRRRITLDLAVTFLQRVLSDFAVTLDLKTSIEKLWQPEWEGLELTWRDAQAGEFCRDNPIPTGSDQKFVATVSAWFAVPRNQRPIVIVGPGANVRLFDRENVPLDPRHRATSGEAPTQGSLEYYPSSSISFTDEAEAEYLDRLSRTDYQGFCTELKEGDIYHSLAQLGTNFYINLNIDLCLYHALKKFDKNPKIILSPIRDSYRREFNANQREATRRLLPSHDPAQTLVWQPFGFACLPGEEKNYLLAEDEFADDPIDIWVSEWNLLHWLMGFSPESSVPGGFFDTFRQRTNRMLVVGAAMESLEWRVLAVALSRYFGKGGLNCATLYTNPIRFREANRPVLINYLRNAPNSSIRVRENKEIKLMAAELKNQTLRSLIPTIPVWA